MNRHWDRLAAELALKPQLLRKIRLDMCLRIERELPKVTSALREQVAHPEGLAMVDWVQAEIRRCTGQVAARASTSDHDSDGRTAPGDPPKSNP